jgi:hypothetical protein
MLTFRKLASVLAVTGALAAAGVAQAATIDGGLVVGRNTLLDESRETYVDNGDGLFGVGDVIFGYIRISDFQPSGAAGNNQVYGVFSQQVLAGSAGRNVVFGATTVAGLTLKELLGNNANVGASALAAFYDSPAPFTDLINSNPAGPPANMQGYIDYIRNTGALRVVAGFGDADDFLFSEISLQATGLGVAVGSPNIIFTNPALGPNYTIASNFGAFSVLYNDTSFVFNDVVPTGNPVGGAVLGEIVISSGTTAGANTDDVLPFPKNWLNAGAFSQSQCETQEETSIACGFINKNNFTVDVSRVPEPGSMVLLSGALLALGGLSRRLKRRAA